jgi:hypothetical protein
MSIYTNTARFDTSRELTEMEMRKLAPSIFATSAHESRSERFMPIPTIEVLRGLKDEGFVPVGVKQSASRTPGKADFTKHLTGHARALTTPCSNRIATTASTSVTQTKTSPILPTMPFQRTRYLHTRTIIINTTTVMKVAITEIAGTFGFNGFTPDYRCNLNSIWLPVLSPAQVQV